MKFGRFHKLTANKIKKFETAYIYIYIYGQNVNN
jgi:hypothetical protein